MRRVLLSRLSIVVPVLSLLVAPRPASAQESAYLPGEVIVRFQPGTDSRSIQTILALRGCAVKEAVPRLGILLVEYSDSRPVEQVVAALTSHRECDFAHPNYLGSGGYIPNDSHFHAQWHHNNTGQTGGTPGADIESPAGWDVTRGWPSVVVAVLDSGIDTDHVEFAGRYLPGFDFVNEDGDPEDDHSHGSLVTGIVAAIADNAFAVAGVDHDCTILPVKVLNQNNAGSTMDLIQGLDYSAVEGADIISMSLINYPGTGGLQAALQAARDAGAVLIACAGNGGIGNADVSWPGASPLTISVGATDHTDFRASFSGTGNALDLVAPGVNVRTIRYNSDLNGSSLFTGCSAATPVVAGVASLCLALDGSLTHADIESVLIAGAEDQVGRPSEDTPGWDPFHGHGRVNMRQTLESVIDSSCAGQVAQPICNDDRVCHFDGDFCGGAPAGDAWICGGAWGQGLCIDGGSLDLGQGDVFSQPDLEIEFQARLNRLPSSGMDHLVSKYVDGSLPESEWLVAVRSDGSWMLCGDGSLCVTSAPGLVRPGRWYCVRVGLQGDHGEMWINGKLVASGPVARNLAGTTTPVLVGAGSPGGFRGVIDELRIGCLNLPPTCDTGGPYAGLVGAPVQLDGGASSDPDGTIASYEWQFGDGATGSGPTPTHVYSPSAIYTVTLCVTDDASAQVCCETTASIGDAIPGCDPREAQAACAEDILCHFEAEFCAGTPVGSVEFCPGAWGQGICVDVDGRLDLGDDDAFSQSQFEVELQVVFDQVPGSGSSYLAAKYVDGQPDLSEWGLFAESGVVFQRRWALCGDGQQCIASESGLVEPDRRYCVRGVWRGDQAEIWVDDQLVASGQISLNGSNTTTPVEIGRSFAGMADELRIGCATTTGVGQRTGPGSAARLFQSHPNPFNPTTVIEYEAPRAGPVRLSIFDSSGRLVRVLVASEVVAGRHSVRWDGTDGHGSTVASGVYFYQLEIESFRETRRVVLVR